MRVEGNDSRLAAAAATQMQQTGVQQSLASKVYQHSDSPSNSSDTIHSIGDKVSIKVDLPHNTVETLQKMGNISDFLNSVATNLRQTSDGLKAASDVVSSMKSSLDNITKTYPPYALDSKERIDELMKFSSLRKQIESMMVPAPPPPIYEKVQHLWEDLFTKSGNTMQLPSLPSNAPDSHIATAGKQLDVISSQIGLVQDSMRKSVTTS